jgi:hypothetical protein
VSVINENLQLSTAVNDIILGNDVHFRAVNLKLWGLTYREMARELGRREQTVRSWFCKDGECYEAYEELKKQRREDLRQNLENLKDNLDEIILASLGIVRKAVTEKKNEAVAVKMLLASGLVQGFEVPQPIKQDSEFITLLRASISTYEKMNKLSNPLDTNAVDTD